MVDLSGIVIYHPFKPYELDRPVMYYDLEKHPIIRSEMEKYLKNRQSNSTISITVEGDFPINVNLDGSKQISYKNRTATYVWRKSENLVIAIVIFDDEKSVIASKLDNAAPSPSCGSAEFIHHSTDVQFDNWRRINERLVNYEQTLTMFGVQSYRKEKYVTEEENQLEIDDVRKCLNNFANCTTDENSLKQTALDDLCSTSMLNQWSDDFRQLSEQHQSIISG